MRTAIIAAVVAALFVGPALAQGRMGGGGQRGMRGAQQPTAQDKEKAASRKATDEAYKRSLKQIPDSTEKIDPWKNAR